jgi:peptide alpha-N-acetyltransferase
MQIFDEIEEDQYDFHGYNLRKFTINAYLECVSATICFLSL